MNREALDKAVRALQLRDIYFRDEKVTLRKDLQPHFLPEAWRAQFRVSTRILHDFEATPGIAGEAEAAAPLRFCEIEFSGAVRCVADDDGKESGDSPDELLLSEVSIGLLYLVVDECPDECLEEFVRTNAAYHAIPYWREHVHAVCAKRRFPPITVPMYSVLARSGQTAQD